MSDTIANASSTLTSYLMGTGASLADAMAATEAAAKAGESNYFEAGLANTTATADILGVGATNLLLLNKASTISTTASNIANSNIVSAATELAIPVAEHLPTLGAILSTGTSLTKLIKEGDIKVYRDSNYLTVRP